jgi:hypothetical protein
MEVPTHPYCIWLRVFNICHYPAFSRKIHYTSVLCEWSWYCIVLTQISLAGTPPYQAVSPRASSLLQAKRSDVGGPQWGNY